MLSYGITMTPLSLSAHFLTKVSKFTRSTSVDRHRVLYKFSNASDKMCSELVHKRIKYRPLFNVNY